MIQQHELITLICSIGVGVLSLSYRKHLWRVPGSRLLFSAYGLLVVGWAVTILQTFLWPGALTVVRHLCQAAAAIVLLLWIARLPAAGEGETWG
jgi:hypothetical protein